MHRKEPLYRRVNTKARGVHHDKGGDYRWSRRKDDRAARGAMSQGRHRGLDYTPLFRFLLSREGRRWDAVYAEAKTRLDTTEPIFWLVALREDEGQPCVRTGESSYFSGLFVDAEGILRRVDPALVPADMKPDCTCCTHTLNGVRFGDAAG